MSRGSLRSSHSFDGVDAPPGSRQLLPTTAMGSGILLCSAIVNERLVMQARKRKGKRREAKKEKQVNNNKEKNKYRRGR